MKGVRYFTPNTETHPQFAEALQKTAKNSDGIAKKAVYKGAGTAADEIKKEIESLPASGIAIQGKKDHLNTDH